MGYPIFGKVKNIVLPCDTSDPLTLDQYKEKYGIDLKEFLVVENNVIKFKADNSVIYIQTRNEQGAQAVYGTSFLCPVTSSLITAYESGQSSAKLMLGVYNNDEQDYCGIGLTIDKDDEYTLDNVKVSYYGF